MRGQTDITHEDIRGEAARKLPERFFHGGSRVHLRAMFLKHLLHRCGGIILVLHHQDARRVEVDRSHLILCLRGLHPGGRRS